MRRPEFPVLLAALAAAGALSCGPARAFLDIPESSDGPEPVQETGAARVSGFALLAADTLPPPPIESLEDRDSALALLPRDNAGGVDWVQAVAREVIRPRARISGAASGPQAESGYDFYLKGDGPEAYFPHSTHTYWVDCQSCHPAIYRYRGADSVTVAPGHADNSCGACHGTAAFSSQACERCHAALGSLPAGRLPALPKGDRVVVGAARVAPPADAAAGELDVSDLYPPAQFEHWVHQIRYRCKACHEAPFKMKAGASGITQGTGHGTEACGQCHDGRSAFDVGVTTCDRCHYAEPAEGP